MPEAPSPCSSTTASSPDEGYIRQCFLRGHRAPAFSPPPRRYAKVAKKDFKGPKDLCVKCMGEKYARNRPKLEVYDCYLEDCQRCKKRTMHIGPGWCVYCNAVPDGELTSYCDSCDLVFEIPEYVKNDHGGVVDLLKVVHPSCAQCSGIASSWETSGDP
ncbi:hypothetical protein EDB80DRAFT_592104 [Ilyonectria destructans]|nr:hypothetical protein EDB80DRAFT_592104 [Ilyonectria destructans]